MRIVSENRSTAGQPKASDRASRAGTPPAVDHVHPRAPANDDPRLQAWRAFLFAQSTVMPALDAEMQSEVGLTLAEFDALAQLSFARQRRLRMSELAERVLLSRSGVTRMVDRLERAGHVRREPCAPDGRGFYATLTEQGLQRVRQAMPAHLAAVDAHFMEHIAARDDAALVRALGAVAKANGRPLPSAGRSAAALDRLGSRDDEG